MDYSVKIGPLQQQKAAAIIVGVFDEQRLTGTAQALNQLTDGQVKLAMQQGDLGTKSGHVHLLTQPKGAPFQGAPFQRLLLVNCGDKAKFDTQTFTQVSHAAFKALRALPCKEVINTLIDLPVGTREFRIQRSFYFANTDFYQFGDFKSKKLEKFTLKKMIFLAKDTNDAKTLRTLASVGQALDQGMSLTKTLGNTPSNVCTPTYLAQQARHLAKQYPSLTTKIVDGPEMKKLGMHSLLSVAKGSQEPPKMIIMEYRGSKKKSTQPIALVGKGVTFDTGGISLKPSLKMEEMKFDMQGAGSVFGTIKAIAELKLPINVIGIVGAVENMPSHMASKPGDIVTTLSGQTVEIINTDAEGRLVLCDLLTYVQRYKPETIIDIATLTGAMCISLGEQAAGVFTHDDDLAKQMAHASEQTGDRSWRFPMWPEYFEALQSPYADMMNCGSRDAGSITAAIFLSQFTKNQHWLHLDIASVAWNNEGHQCASGRPVPLLVEFLRQRVK